MYLLKYSSVFIYHVIKDYTYPKNISFRVSLQSFPRLLSIIINNPFQNKDKK